MQDQKTVFNNLSYIHVPKKDVETCPINGINRVSCKEKVRNGDFFTGSNI